MRRLTDLILLLAVMTWTACSSPEPETPVTTVKAFFGISTLNGLTVCN